MYEDSEALHLNKFGKSENHSRKMIPWKRKSRAQGLTNQPQLPESRNCDIFIASFSIDSHSKVSMLSD